MSIKVNIKWGKELFKDIDLNIQELPIIFKAQLFALTNVQPDRQKIMLKGQTLGNDSWSNFELNLKPNITLMMMGSVDSLPQAPPPNKVQFMEDLTEAQLAQALDLPVGLKNLGNTCYLNAVLQCFKVVPELCKSLNGYKLNSTQMQHDMSNNLIITLRDTYEFMDKHKLNGYPPLLLVQLLRTVFPQFATTGENGIFMQQDANECWTELMRILQQKLPPVSSSNHKYTNFIDQYFSGQFVCKLKCEEAPEEVETEMKESFLQLSCFISQDVKYLQTGIKLRLEEKLTKNSPSLNKDAIYTKISKISRLPAYIGVQFVRFYYKEKEKINAKILKDVKFQTTLDLYELCTDELKAKLVEQREKYRLVDDKQAHEVRTLKQQIAQDASNVKQKQVTVINDPSNCASFSFDDDIGSSNSGLYELIAVLTHKGRSSNSGHYVGWSRNATTGEWMMFDDDEVTKVSEEDILKLSGGGDWHTAYILLYGPRKLNLKSYEEGVKFAAENAKLKEDITSNNNQEKK